jgi:predicted murein hydrolase (TIGR00659 family)
MLEHLPPFFHVWAYLQTQPLLGLTATLCVWEIAVWLDARAGHNALTNPTVLSIIILATLLIATHTSYAAYFTGAVYIHFLLGPATVALAVPMFDHWQAIRRNFLPIILSLTAGSVVSAGSAMLIAMAFHAPKVLVISLGPKSVTTAIAMGVSQALGGQPALTAVFVLLTGMFGTVVCTGVLRAARVHDWRAQGLAAGTAAHGLATARMLGLNQAAGAFGGLAIGLNGMVTSVALPVMTSLLGL